MTVKNIIEIMTNPGGVTLSPEEKAGYLYNILENFDLMIWGDAKTPPELDYNWGEIRKNWKMLEPYAVMLSQKIKAQKEVGKQN